MAKGLDRALVKRLVEVIRAGGHAHDIDPDEHAKRIAEVVALAKQDRA